MSSQHILTIKNENVPSGKPFHNYGKSTCLPGKLIISTGPFSISLCVKLPEGILHGHQKSTRCHVGHDGHLMRIVLQAMAEKIKMINDRVFLGCVVVVGVLVFEGF